jgi:hypothetical protein
MSMRRSRRAPEYLAPSGRGKPGGSSGPVIVPVKGHGEVAQELLVEEFGWAVACSSVLMVASLPLWAHAWAQHRHRPSRVLDTPSATLYPKGSETTLSERDPRRT